MEGSDRVLSGNEQRTPREKLIDEVNHYATLYAQVRKKAEAEAEGRLTMEEVHAKLSNHEYKLIAWQKAYELLWEGRDGHFYYYIGERRLDLGEDSGDYIFNVLKYLDKYDPDYISPKQNEKSKFTTYFAKRIAGMSKDYIEKEEVKEEKEISVDDCSDDCSDEDGKPSIQLGENETGYENADLISSFEKFSTVLLKHTEIVGVVNRRAERRRERFFAYHTRAYVQLCEYLADQIRGSFKELDKTLSQPYILYLRKEEVQDHEDAKRRLYIQAAQGENAHVGAVRLKELYMRGNLIHERYDKKQAMNIYFKKSNLSMDMGNYDNLLRLFLTSKAEG